MISADDGMLLGEGIAVSAVFARFREALALGGLEVNVAKCCASMKPRVPQPSGVKTADKNCPLVVLGFPVQFGTPCDRVLL